LPASHSTGNKKAAKAINQGGLLVRSCSTAYCT
jgi:hypothetical protein